MRNQKLTLGKSEAEIREGWDGIKGVVQKIVSTREFKPNPNKFCNWCDFKKICSEYKNDKTKARNELHKRIEIKMDLQDSLFKELCL